MRFRFFAERQDYGRFVAVNMYRDEESGNRVIAEPVVLKTLTPEEEESARPQKPMLLLRQDEAQRLMDELWQTGLRPTEGTGSAGSLAATQHHLKDMQRIVMHTLKIPDQQTRGDR